MPVLSATRALRVMIVDDCAVVREGLRAILHSEPGLRVVGEAADGETAVASVAKAAPDVVLLDISLPGMDGIEAARRLRRLRPDAALVMISINDDLGHVLESFQAGAKGYVVKDSAADEIVDALAAVRAGRLFCSASIRRALAEDVGGDPRGAALSRALAA